MYLNISSTYCEKYIYKYSIEIQFVLKYIFKYLPATLLFFSSLTVEKRFCVLGPFVMLTQMLFSAPPFCFVSTNKFLGSMPYKNTDEINYKSNFKDYILRTYYTLVLLFCFFMLFQLAVFLYYFVFSCCFSWQSLFTTLFFHVVSAIRLSLLIRLQ